MAGSITLVMWDLVPPKNQRFLMKPPTRTGQAIKIQGGGGSRFPELKEYERSGRVSIMSRFLGG